MNVGVVGAGFTGLAAGYYLSKKKHNVTIFEKDRNPGGLAIGYKEPKWDWTLEEHYHHWFTNDSAILNLAREIGHQVIIKRPKTSSYVDNEIFQLDSPLSLLGFPKLSTLEKVRMGVSLASLKYNPFWKPLERFYATDYLKKTMGEKAYKTIWKPLLKNKLGKYSNRISLVWFWARIYKRTSELAYPEEGFLTFARSLQKRIEKFGGKFFFNTEVLSISSKNSPKILFKNFGNSKIESKNFDVIIVTVPSFLFRKIAEKLPKAYTDKLKTLKMIGAMNMVLRLKKPFLKDGTYWLNICEDKSPILAVVEHTNFIDKKYYNNENIVYLGNYLENSDHRFKMTPDELLTSYDPLLRKINMDYKSNIIGYKLFKAPFAQPIIPINYSKHIPSFSTPLNNIFLANIEQVYPWDRGTNYAVELGERIANIISK